MGEQEILKISLPKQFMEKMEKIEKALGSFTGQPTFDLGEGIFAMIRYLTSQISELRKEESITFEYKISREEFDREVSNIIGFPVPKESVEKAISFLMTFYCLLWLKWIGVVAEGAVKKWLEAVNIKEEQ
jgi:hypothetical protein